ncbi:MAG: hypothetical protein JWO25_49 [Alphaproteobacteria bacterium]|nr:hypothetical protein [Alphaproteobacteria bacterium]
MPQAPPHEGVYVRLGVSRIDGVGVFAIRPIPKGTNIFANDAVEMVWVDKACLDAEGLTGPERELYSDFAIRKGGKLGCPINFNSLTPGWYLNEPGAHDQANVESDDRFNFTASRDIEKGEELTIRYPGFSAAD